PLAIVHLNRLSTTSSVFLEPKSWPPNSQQYWISPVDWNSITITRYNHIYSLLIIR
ncbi:hypothetical protein Dimus_013482, partial [Dionaea muscipula]